MSDPSDHQHLTPALVLALEQLPTLRPFLDHLCSLCPDCQQAATDAIELRRRGIKSERPLLDPSKAADQAQRVARDEEAAALRDLEQIEPMFSDPDPEARINILRLVRDAHPDRFRSPVLIAECLEKSRAATRGQQRTEAKFWATVAHIVAARNVGVDLMSPPQPEDATWRDTLARSLAGITPHHLGLLAETTAAVSRTARQAGNPGEALEFLSNSTGLFLGDPATADLMPLDGLLEFQRERGATYLALRKYDLAIADLETSQGLAVVLDDAEELAKTEIYLAMALRHRNPRRALELSFAAIESPLSPYLQASAVNEAVMILLLDLNRLEDAWNLFQKYEDRYFQCTDRGAYVCDRHSWAVARFKAAFGEHAAALEHYGSLLERWESDTETATALNVALVVLEVAVIHLKQGAFDQVIQLANSSATTFAAAGLEANAAEAFELVRGAALCHRLTVAELWRVHRYLRNPEALNGSYAVSS